MKVGRAVTPALVVLNTIRTIRDLRDSDITYSAPTEYPVSNDKDWPRTIKSLVEFLGTCLGETKIPLAYVIHETVELLDVADTPADYAYVGEEMTWRAPHDTAIYRADNKKVWDIIYQITRDADCWAYAKPTQRTHNGRMAFHRWYDHYLGANNVNNMASGAEHMLANGHYVDEKKRWTFERYVRQQVEQHSILKGLTDHGHCGIDAGSEVRFLLAGIKTPSLELVKTQILAKPDPGTNFHRCVNLFKDFINQSATLQMTGTDGGVNISQTIVTPGNEGGDHSPDGDKPDD